MVKLHLMWHFRVGIIGEPIEMFNPDLTPKNVDNDDEADSGNTGD